MKQIIYLLKGTVAYDSRLVAISSSKKVQEVLCVVTSLYRVLDGECVPIGVSRHSKNSTVTSSATFDWLQLRKLPRDPFLVGIFTTKKFSYSSVIYTKC